MFFSKFLLEIGAKLAENKEAKKFSVETIYYDEPIGIHAAEKYLDKEMIENIILKSQLFHESSNINISI